ncbi:beta strand repeat-containing protein [Botrimarina mediterranea]|uniref:Autotransporter-associated beta strand repeat protein n=1 Tax=Botrimarina mediterranea TaxID=2528022 RepID=A0A518K6T5_9BACT|nr:PEP-CTERM sorting domain-containing protein [Botrimarina mediterranea]QDV73511.1 hypothetical protein Spa11_17090 [Botrimarina mediterranea]QDV78102.1 hypothetical protein K2D_17080 [Planctomycetes bacterium K2D]
MPLPRQRRQARPRRQSKTLTTLVCRFGLAALIGGASYSAHAVTLRWDDAGNSASKLWSDNGNWSPDSAVSTNDDIIIGDLANAASDQTIFDINEQIASLSLSSATGVTNSSDSGASAPNTRELIVNGATTLSGAGTNLTLYGRAGDAFDTNTLDLSGGARVTLNSQAGIGTAILEVDSGLFDIGADSSLTGNGRVDLEDASPGGAHVVLRNDGTISAGNIGLVFLSPPARTLQLTATSVDARFDWDGLSGNGVININGNATLDVDVSTGTDGFGGVMNLSTGSTLDMAHTWTLDAGVINVNTAAFGFTLPGSDPNPGPAARLAGAAWTMTGGEINIDDAWDSLQLDSSITATGGVVNNNGTMIFNANATFGSGVDFNMIAGNDSGASLVINAVVNIDTADFNLDGQGLAPNVTTINAGGNLDLDLGAGADEDFDHTINLNGGELDVTTADNTWSVTSGGEINVGGGATSTINGETFSINGDVNVASGASLNVNAVSEYGLSSAVVIDAGGELNHNLTSYNGGSFTGGGVFRKGNATIAADTTWGVATLDLDDGATEVLNNAKLTINATAIDSAGDGVDAAVNVANLGQFEVNLTGGGDVVFEAGSLNYAGDASANTFVTASTTGSALRFDAGSQLNVTGDGSIASRVKLNGGALNNVTLGEGVRLAGGSQVAGDTNEITGGVVNGPGNLVIESGAALRGHGAINAPVDGNGTAQLIATGGQLNVNGGIVDAGTVGTNGAGSVLNVTTPWNTNAIGLVVLEEGTVQGSTVTNDGNGFRGRGAILSRVINNSAIISTTPGTLVVDNNTNDWDGAANTGTLRATQGTLELRDNAAFLYNGTVIADGGTVFANGFELEFDPASQLTFSSGVYRSTHATDIGGTVTVMGGASRMEVAGTVVFETGSNTTLTGDLRLANAATRIQSGAVFSGTGELINDSGSSLGFDDGALVGAQVTNQGFAAIAAGAAGRVDLDDYLQSASGVLQMDINGDALGQFDRLVASGIAQVGGELRVMTGGFGPTLGTTVQLITAAGGVLGTFADVVDGSGNLPAGTQWEAIYNANSVQVVLDLVLPGDFNNDGSVDAADYTVYRDNFGAAVTLPGDPTPGTVTAADHAVWAANYGATAPAPSMAFAMASAVPEPTTAALVVLAAAGLAGARRRD